MTPTLTTLRQRYPTEGWHLLTPTMLATANGTMTVSRTPVALGGLPWLAEGDTRAVEGRTAVEAVEGLRARGGA